MERTMYRFTLFQRNFSNGPGRSKKVWYAKILDRETGRLIKRISTGMSSKSRAEAVVRTRVTEMEREDLVAASPPVVTVSELSEGFFSKTGHYAESRRVRGYPVSNGHLDIQTGCLKKHILPRWNDTNVTEITAGMVDRWIIDLHQKRTLAPGTINKILQCLRSVLDGAVSLGHIGDNPAASVKPVRSVPRRRGILTDDEVKDLLQWPGPWRDYRHYTINLLAFATGARIGEIRGLLVDHVHSDRVDIVHGWEEGYGLKEPKYGSVRSVPISTNVSLALTRVIKETCPSSLLFYGAAGYDKPMSKSHIEKQLLRAIIQLKTPADTPKGKRSEVQKDIEQEIRSRNITFHSWRHKLNTVLRSAGVPDSKIRILTGHRNETMTNWYTAYATEDFDDVRSLQAKLLKQTA